MNQSIKVCANEMHIHNIITITLKHTNKYMFRQYSQINDYIKKVQ